MKKALVIIISIAAIVLISLCIAWGAEYHLKGTDWPANSCGEQVRAIMEQRPDITVFWGMINQPGHPGHGQWHVQAYDPQIEAWLTIDKWHKIDEHREMQYTMKYCANYTARTYARRYEIRRGK
jgi:hypothetical protein